MPAVPRTVFIKSVYDSSLFFVYAFFVNKIVYHITVIILLYIMYYIYFILMYFVHLCERYVTASSYVIMCNIAVVRVVNL